MDKAIKSGIVKELIKKNGYNLILQEYKKDNFVFDLSIGSISSTDFPEASEEVRKVANTQSTVVGLIPFEEEDKSVALLFNREKDRTHFRDANKDELLSKTKMSFPRFSKLLKEFCNAIIYTEDKTPEEIAEEIVNYIKK